MNKEQREFQRKLKIVFHAAETGLGCQDLSVFWGWAIQFLSLASGLCLSGGIRSDKCAANSQVTRESNVSRT